MKVERPVVLVVDDDPFTRRWVINKFHSETIIGTVEADGLANAAELIEDRHSHFDAILCDLGFPSERRDPIRNLSDGLDLLRHARKVRPRLRLYVLSVFADNDYERKWAKRMKLGVSGWFAKLPLNPSRSCWETIEADLVLTQPKARASPTKSSERRRSSDFEFDVFLAHSSKDKKDAERLAIQLQELGLKPWLDAWNSPPGRLFQEEIEEVVPKVRCVAILCGKSGVGPWERLEIRLAITQFVRRRSPVIPVLLPGAKRMAELPLFLHEFGWVKFNGSLADKRALKQLVWGITGLKPGKL